MIVVNTLIFLTALHTKAIATTMVKIKVKYQAFGKIDEITWPYHTPIGLIHEHLYNLCSTYVIIEITNGE